MTMSKLNIDIVYITDKPVDTSKADLSTTQLEGNSSFASKRIYEALSSICNRVYYYDDLADFCENLYRHKQDLVFTTMYGKASANSKALVPSICEANNIHYIGADSYSQMLCNDKYLSKRYASEYGIPSASDVIIRRPDSEYELSLLSTLKYPVVIKPNFGGGSTGISQNNVKFSFSEAKSFVQELYHLQRQPILVEEYIDGYEVELILLGNPSEIKLCYEVQLVMNGDTFFKNFIWSYETKKVHDEDISFYSSHLFSPTDIKKLVRLFQSFSKIEFMRIDCRISDKGLKLIELSPDCYLGEDCAFYYAFQQNGFSFPEMFYQIIHNSISYQNILK